MNEVTLIDTKITIERIPKGIPFVTQIKNDEHKRVYIERLQALGYNPLQYIPISKVDTVIDYTTQQEIDRYTFNIAVTEELKEIVNLFTVKLERKVKALERELYQERNKSIFKVIKYRLKNIIKGLT